jgi:hypothetical protein
MKTILELRQELDAEKAELEKRLEGVEDRLMTLTLFEEHFGNEIALDSLPTVHPKQEKAAPRGKRRQTKWPLSIGDAAEKVLKKAENHELPILDILKGIDRLGVKPSRQTLTSGLRKDHHNRFEALGEGKYKLRE